ncbi:hypothetical protein ACFQS4_05940 [Saliphagus sp. GCM10025317]
MNRYHIPAIVLLVIGVGLLVGLGYAVLSEPSAERTYSIEEVGSVTNYGPDTDSMTPTYNYSELSSEGKETFRKTLDSDDGTYVETGGRGEFAPDFHPPQDTHSGDHRIRYDDTYYNLGVQSTDTGGYGLVFAIPFVLLTSTIFISLGAVGAGMSRPIFPTAILVGLGYLVVRSALFEPSAGTLPAGLSRGDLGSSVLLMIGTYVVIRGRFVWKHRSR